MSLIWNARVIWRGPLTGGAQDPETGIYSGGARPVRYEGEASVQDTRYELRRGMQGGVELDADAQLYLPVAVPDAGELGDEVEVEREGRTRLAEVRDINLTQCRVMLVWREGRT